MPRHRMNKYCVVCNNKTNTNHNKGKIPCKLPKIQDVNNENDEDDVELGEEVEVRPMTTTGTISTTSKRQPDDEEKNKSKKFKSLQLMGTSLTR